MVSPHPLRKPLSPFFLRWGGRGASFHESRLPRLFFLSSGWIFIASDSLVSFCKNLSASYPSIFHSAGETDTGSLSSFPVKLNLGAIAARKFICLFVNTFERES